VRVLALLLLRCHLVADVAMSPSGLPDQAVTGVSGESTCSQHTLRGIPCHPCLQGAHSFECKRSCV